MNKLKMLLTSASFAVAVLFSFAFKTSSPKNVGYLKTGTCSTTVNCIGNARTCAVGSVNAYLEPGSCITLAKMQ